MIFEFSLFFVSFIKGAYKSGMTDPKIMLPPQLKNLKFPMLWSQPLHSVSNRVACSIQRWKWYDRTTNSFFIPALVPAQSGEAVQAESRSQSSGAGQLPWPRSLRYCHGRPAMAGFWVFVCLLLSVGLMGGKFLVSFVCP